ncbi:MAG: hypothetical protein KDK55_07200, partial [Chlamydiia bacterium]|nr:hypothetical protein [Chlamydiia bacterium]
TSTKVTAIISKNLYKVFGLDLEFTFPEVIHSSKTNLNIFSVLWKTETQHDKGGKVCFQNWVKN